LFLPSELLVDSKVRLKDGPRDVSGSHRLGFFERLQGILDGGLIVFFLAIEVLCAQGLAVLGDAVCFRLERCERVVLCFSPEFEGRSGSGLLGSQVAVREFGAARFGVEAAGEGGGLSSGPLLLNGEILSSARSC
jgi:hypothetical protein